jgi:hypothetical protein
MRSDEAQPRSAHPASLELSPLFEVQGGHQLVPFRQCRGGVDLYEREIEDLLWEICRT